MRLTRRDVALLQNIARLRLAASAQLAALDGEAHRMSHGPFWHFGRMDTSSDLRRKSQADFCTRARVQQFMV